MSSVTLQKKFFFFLRIQRQHPLYTHEKLRFWKIKLICLQLTRIAVPGLGLKVPESWQCFLLASLPEDHGSDTTCSPLSPSRKIQGSWPEEKQLRKSQGRERINQEYGINRYTLTYIKYINKDLLCSTGNYIQYLVMVYNGKELEKGIYICVCMCVCVESFFYILKANTIL